MTTPSFEDLEVFFRLSQDLLLITDLEGTLIAINPAWERVLGYSLDELKQKRLREFIHFDDREFVLATLGRLAGGTKSSNLEFRFVCKNGELRWLRWHAVPDLERGRIVAIGRDVTAELAAKVALEQEQSLAVRSFEERTDFLIKMSQEVRTPLSSIIGKAGLLLDTSLNPEQRGNISSVLESAEELLDLFNEILDYSRLERGELELEISEVDLLECVLEVFSLVEPEARRQGMAFQRPDWGEQRVVYCDPWRIQQVLLHLLTIAMDLAQDSGVSVTWSLGRPETSWISLDLDILDSGAEIHEEWLEQLFAPFSKSDVLASGGASGSVLGLAITREILDLMGGSIRLTTESDGGNRLCVSVPFELVSTEHLAGAVPDTPTAPLPLFARKGSKQVQTVLVVEDNPVNQRLAVRMLEEAGYNCEVANNGQEALETITSQKCDMVLMDARMPVMDGYTATTRIRELEGDGPHVPIVAMTADAMPGVRQRCLDSGMDDCLIKPIRQERLVATVRQYLGPRTDELPAQYDTSRSRAPVDLAMLREVTDDDPAFQRELTGLFLNDVQRHLAVISSEAERRELETVSQRAHSIKGAASHVGAQPLSELANELEVAAASGDATAALSLILAIEVEFGQTRAYLNAYFQQSG